MTDALTVEAIDRRIADLETSITRAVALGAPSAGIAEAHRDLRELKEERAGIARKLTSQAAPRSAPGDEHGVTVRRGSPQ